MMKKLLTESFVFHIQKTELLESENGGKKRLIARGQFGKADIPTANRRIYPKTLWERELAKLKPKMEDNQVYGELDHPGDGMTKLQRVSHLIIDAKLRDDGIIEGALVIMPNTKNGKQAIGILEDGGKIGISSRGFGSVTQNSEGYDEVQDDFNLLTWDLVADPAAAGSFPDFAYESKNAPKVQVLDNEDAMTIKNKDLKNVKESIITTSKAEDDSSKKPEDDGKEKDTTKDNQEESTDKFEAIRAQIRQEESEKITALVSKMIEEKTSEIRESVRSEYESNPELAGAKLALESVKTTLRPFIIAKDISEEISLKEAKITNLEESLKAKDVELSEYKDVTKELGFKLRIEQVIADVPYKEEIRKYMGDVKQFESMANLDARLGKVLNYVKQKQEQLEAKVKAAEANKQSEINTLKAKVESLEAEKTNAIKLAEKHAAKNYLLKVTEGNKYAPNIAQIVESKGLVKAEEIDAVVEQFAPMARKDSLVNKVQRRLQPTAEQNKTLVESNLKETQTKEEEMEIIEGTGITVNQIKTLS